MKKKMFLIVLLTAFCLCFQAAAYSETSLGITGLVKQPLNLTLDDLHKYQSVKVQHSGVMRRGEYRGAFCYRGVPLKSLLETADVQKEESAFSKPVDLAVVVRNREGRQVALSWGEIFFRNPDSFVVATSAEPIMPKRGCALCHKPGEARPWLMPLQREVGLPKLVVTDDEYADRCLENITAIEVLDLRPRMPSEKMKDLSSPSFDLTGEVKKALKVRELPQHPRQSISAKHLGGGRGFHGLNRYEGVSFNSFLKDAGMSDDLNQVVLVSAPDGYRSLFSSGELFLNPLGQRVIVADRMDGKPMENGGKFVLVPPDDLMADRTVKSVSKVEVISLKREPRLYIIGVGCGDTNLITLEAVSSMAKADAFVCSPDVKKRFGKYMGDKPILFNLFDFAPPVLKKNNPGLSGEELGRLMKQERERSVAIIREALNKNMTVAILDYADPTIWGGWGWARNYFDEKTVTIIPGLSSFNAANSLLKKNLGCNGSFVLATPWWILEDRPALKSLAEKGDTICLFMGIRDLPRIVEVLKQHYRGETPAAIVYKAGYSGSEKAVRTTLDGLQKAADSHKEKFLCLIYIGPCLDAWTDECCNRPKAGGEPKQK